MRVLRLEVTLPLDGRAGIFMGYDAPIDHAIQLAMKRRGTDWPEMVDMQGSLSPYRHPTPRRDVPAWERMVIENIYEAQRYFCGFRDIEQLLAWFDSEALRTAMNDVGITLYEYEIDPEHVMHGQHQVMFRKDLAQEIGHSPVPTLAEMQVEPAAIAA